MLLRSLFDDVWVYPDLDNLEPTVIVNRGEVLVRIGVEGARNPSELCYYKVYIPGNGAVGWVLNDNVEEVK
jgi:hypothetical protein